VDELRGPGRRLPLTWPPFAADLDAAGDADPEGFTASTTSLAISCGDAPASVPSSDWSQQIARFTGAGSLWGSVLGWWLWAPCARYDPGTPYRNAQVTENRLGNAERWGHPSCGPRTRRGPVLPADTALDPVSDVDEQVPVLGARDRQ
jgi:hypothetical protein